MSEVIRVKPRRLHRPPSAGIHPESRLRHSSIIDHFSAARGSVLSVIRNESDFLRRCSVAAGDLADFGERLGAATFKRMRGTEFAPERQPALGLVDGARRHRSSIPRGEWDGRLWPPMKRSAGLRRATGAAGSASPTTACLRPPGVRRRACLTGAFHRYRRKGPGSASFDPIPSRSRRSTLLGQGRVDHTAELIGRDRFFDDRSAEVVENRACAET
jgi:hypothetical protein